ncbi:MAG: peptidylprolyl isomerase [Planctomycetes bacterium]|nr:peptidylprolyl isomerase [Planctomycetota bacterium]
MKIKKTCLTISFLGMSLFLHAEPQPHSHGPSCNHGPAPATNEISPTATVATVNGKSISGQELLDEIKRMNRGPNPTTLEQQMQLLDFMIGKMLLLKKADEQKLVVATAEIDKEISSVKSRYPSTEEFEKFLQQNGLDQEKLKKDISQNLLIQKVFDKNVAKKEVTQEEVKAFYDGNSQYFKKPEQVKASHILLKVKEDGSDKEAVTKQLMDIKKQAVAGADFAELAKKHSQGPSGPGGGDLGQFGRGQMVPAFEKAAFSMNIDQVSDVIETQFGLHILKVFEKQEPSVTALKEVEGRIKDHLDQQKNGQAVAAYVKDLRTKAKVEVSLGKS